MAIHSPAGQGRRRHIVDKNLSKRVSFGCTSPDCGVAKHLFKDKLLQKGDSVYILPETEGNYIYEHEGKLKTHFSGNNPQTYTVRGKKVVFGPTDMKGYTSNLNYNDNY